MVALAASASSVASTVVGFMMLPPGRRSRAPQPMKEGYWLTRRRATADRRRRGAIQAACTACVNSATFF